MPKKVGDLEDGRPEQMLRRTAYDRIEALLNDGALTPGQLVSQRELVEKTGSTLGAVREAITRLEAEGLLQTLPKRGLLVPSMDVTFIREAYQLRKIIELSAVDDAIRNIPRARILEWIAVHDARGATQERADTLQRLDWQLHGALVDAMQNDLISNVYRVNTVKIRMAVQFRLRLTPFMADRVASEHLAFLTPLYDGNAERTREALGRHIDVSLTLALGGTV